MSAAMPSCPAGDGMGHVSLHSEQWHHDAGQRLAEVMCGAGSIHYYAQGQLSTSHHDRYGDGDSAESACVKFTVSKTARLGKALMIGSHSCHFPISKSHL